MRVLGIESSCDDSAVAIVDSAGKIHANIISSQIKEHQPYGGVVPEISSRSHLTTLPHLVQSALIEAKLSWTEVDAIAVTAGPGLIGGVLVGVMLAKGIAAALNKPIIAVNHLEGHALTMRLTGKVAFPFLLLLVSGGHCQILEVRGVGQYRLLGTTLDDSIGETFDKVARSLGLGYPGGPIIEQMATTGILRFTLPKPFVNESSHCNFSLSGLKTAAKRLIDSMHPLSQQDIADVCASFQYTVLEILKSRVASAIKMYEGEGSKQRVLVVAGGVAANQYLRQGLTTFISTYGYQLLAPPLALCTDNAAMIAWAGVERLALGLTDSITFEPRSRWPLS